MDEVDKAVDDEDHEKHLHVVQHSFRKQFDDGDKLALLDCIRWCEEYGVELPGWALRELSIAAGRYLYGVSQNYHVALLGAITPGRHGNPATRRRYEQEHQLWFDLVWALRQHEFKGYRLYEQAQKLLGEIYIDADGRLTTGERPKREDEAIPDPETIRDRVESMKNEGARPSGFAHFIPQLIDITTDRTFADRGQT